MNTSQLEIELTPDHRNPDEDSHNADDERMSETLRAAILEELLLRAEFRDLRRARYRDNGE